MVREKKIVRTSFWRHQKIDNSVTSHNSEWELLTSSDLEDTLLRFTVETKTWKRIKAIVFQVNLQNLFFFR